MKVLFIGCVQFSYDTLSFVYGLKCVDVVGVVTREESIFNSDFKSLSPLARKKGTPVFVSEGNDQEKMADFIRKSAPDVVYCFGWSYLLKKIILDIAPMGVVGFHPAQLPCNRGRHPLIWAIVLGLPHTASTFFFMEEGADDGDILSQEIIDIGSDDSVTDLYSRVSDIAIRQIAEFTKALSDKDFIRCPQDHKQANFWRKRGVRDGEIDWRMHAISIHRLVRALTRPYIGAHVLMGDKMVKIWEVKIHEKFLDINIEPGKILAVKGDEILVKCSDKAIWIVDHDAEKLPAIGSYL